jgi:hypothetical protein
MRVAPSEIRHVAFFAQCPELRQSAKPQSNVVLVSDNGGRYKARRLVVLFWVTCLDLTANDFNAFLKAITEALSEAPSLVRDNPASRRAREHSGDRPTTEQPRQDPGASAGKAPYD